MATKAERFRYQAERGSARPPQPKRTRRRQAMVDTSLPHTSESDRRAGGLSTGRRNLSRGKKAVFAFEDSKAPSAPSRKSTRKSKNRQKAATTKKSAQLLEVATPRRRHSAAVDGRGRPR